MSGTPLLRIARASADVRAATGRNAKVELLAACIAAVDPPELPAALGFLAGELRQRQLGAGWAALRDLPPPAAEPSLTVAETDAVFAAVSAASGDGSAGRRRELLHALYGRAVEPEQELLRGLIGGELRQGAQRGTLELAVARAAGVPLPALRRALMLRGDLGEVAVAAMTEGEAGLQRFGLQVGRPILPMLAGTATDVHAGLERLGAAAVEWKLDGARVQIHRDGNDVAVFTRSLDEITDRVPELVAAARALPVRAVVLDGEAIVLQANGRPAPFQQTGRRIGSSRSVERLAVELPLTPMLFDLLHLDGRDLLDLPGAERTASLRALAPPDLLIPRLDAAAGAEAEAFLEGAIARGHEGVMLKAPDQPYQAGRRAAGWLKVKRAHTFDLVVLAAEWGHGRRRGYLSNLHLGARDAERGGFVMLGKTFKGMTDAMLEWQTGHLLGLESGRSGHVVHVRPELVVEVAFDGVQTSRRYPGGVALRFARVKRYRPDKAAADADTLSAVQALRG